jgi:hypothetical protein
MAEFCWTCLQDELYPEDPSRNDFHGLCNEGETTAVLCEGCGPIEVDHQGKPVMDSVVD